MCSNIYMYFLVVIFVSFIMIIEIEVILGHNSSGQYWTTAVAWQDFCYKNVIFKGNFEHLRHRDDPADFQVRYHVTNQDYEAKNPEAIALPIMSGFQDFRHFAWLN